MELYHALNRGVDQRIIFQDSRDYARFVHDLYEFNDTIPASEFSRRNGTNVGHRMSHIREKLVDLHGWCLMKNHYHLLLSERVEGGLSLFLRKLNVGYARYFNERHKRKGFLLQGRTKKAIIERHAHFLYILHYIHLNPLDYLPGAKEWRIRDQNYISDASKAFEYLKNEFKNRRVKKIYNAFVYGALPEKQGTINLPIGKSRKDFPLWSAERDARGTLREAVTEYRVLSSTPQFSFVEVSPKSGRTHQIRVHFKALRHPIVCDKLYAPNRPCALGFTRLALHALSLELSLPSGARIKLETPLPEDFEKAEKILTQTTA